MKPSPRPSILAHVTASYCGLPGVKWTSLSDVFVVSLDLLLLTSRIPPPASNFPLLTFRFPSLRAAAPGADCHGQNLEVEPEAPAFDVVEIVGQPLGDRTLAAQAVDLRPAG